MFYFLVSYDEFKKASEADLAPMRISEGTIGELFATTKKENKNCSFIEIDCCSIYV